MDKKKVTILLGLSLLAIVLAFTARSLLGGGAAPQVQAALPPIVVPKGPRVLVAQRSLPAGTIITNDAIAFQEWPKDMVNGAYFVDGKFEMNKLLGTVVRFPITAGQPMTTGSLVAPGDRGFLAAALAPGMRAITITVSEKSSVAGFVFPGDHVDLLLTTAVKVPQSNTTLPGAAPDSRDLYATETILKNVRVLATDQSTSQESDNGKTIVHTFHNATLEVTPKIAERIEVAQQGGALSLVLRPISDNPASLDHAIANGSVKLKDGATGADEAKAMAGANLASEAGGSRATLMGGRLDAGPIEKGSSFATAGDVSRFQRRGLPPSGAAAAAAAARAAALAHANEVHILRGSASQAVPMGANGQPAAGLAGAMAQGMGAAANSPATSPASVNN
jgi:pilus assembly protein CpaB